MLDIDAACDQLGHVTGVHIVEYAAGVRELLFDCHAGASADAPALHAVVIDDQGEVLQSLGGTAKDHAPPPACSAPGAFLFEPSPAIMKSGLFAILAAQYELAKLAPATHLFTADHDAPGFPGHRYKVGDVLPVDRKALKRAGITHANVKCRNFSETPAQLQKHLRLRDGGDDYLFACRLADDSYRLIHALRDY